MFCFAENSRYTNEPRCATPTTSSNISRKHLSKSTSELSCHDFSTIGSANIADTPNNSPLRTKHSINPSVVGVLQKTHGFFSTLKVYTRTILVDDVEREFETDFIGHLWARVVFYMLMCNETSFPLNNRDMIIVFVMTKTCENEQFL